MVSFGSTIFSTSKQSMKLIGLSNSVWRKCSQNVVRRLCLRCFTAITSNSERAINSTIDILSNIYLFKVIIKTCFSRLYALFIAKSLQIYFNFIWIFTKCVHCQRRKHSREKQQRPLKEFIVHWTDLDRIPNRVGVIGKNVKNANDISHNKTPKVWMIFSWYGGIPLKRTPSVESR